MKKNFFKDYKNHSIIKEGSIHETSQILKKWNKEIPQHVKNLNTYKEERNYVIYLALVVEHDLNRILEILFPDFNERMNTSETGFNFKINILSAFRLLPEQIFEALRCIKDLRNVFAHDFSIVKLEDINLLSSNRQTKAIGKLTSLTNNFEGDYNYQERDDTLLNRFKSLCLNTITALRIFEPEVISLRNKIETSKLK